MREQGTVKWYSDRKKFGYILKAVGNEELFFHINDFRGVIPEDGMKVDFDLGFDRLGRKKAINIKSVCVGVANEDNHT